MEMSKRLAKWFEDNTPPPPVVTRELIERYFRESALTFTVAIPLTATGAVDRSKERITIAVILENVYQTEGPGYQPSLYGWVALDYPLAIKWEQRAIGFEGVTLEPLRIQSYQTEEGNSTWWIGGDFEFLQILGKALAVWRRFPEPITENGCLTFRHGNPVWIEAFESEVPRLQKGHKREIADYFNRPTKHQFA